MSKSPTWLAGPPTPVASNATTSTLISPKAGCTFPTSNRDTKGDIAFGLHDCGGDGGCDVVGRHHGVGPVGVCFYRPQSGPTFQLSVAGEREPQSTRLPRARFPRCRSG